MQRRIFQVDGVPFVAARSSFFETHGTLAALIEKHRPSATTDRGAEADAAPPQDATPTPGKVASGDTGTLVAVLGVPTPAEPETAQAKRNAPREAAAKLRKPKSPRPKSAPAATDAAPTGETAPEPSAAEDMLTAVEATQGNGPKARVVGRRRAGQPTPPRWTVAGKMRRGRLKERSVPAGGRAARTGGHPQRRPLAAGPPQATRGTARRRRPSRSWTPRRTGIHPVGRSGPSNASRTGFGQLRSMYSFVAGRCTAAICLIHANCRSGKVGTASKKAVQRRISAASRAAWGSSSCIVG